MRKPSRARLKKKIVEMLQTTPVVLAVCKKLAIARSTYYRWIDEDLVFADAVEKAVALGRESVNDLAEHNLIGLISNKDFRATSYWLDHNHDNYRKKPKSDNIIEERYVLSPEKIAAMTEFMRKNSLESRSEVDKEINENGEEKSDSKKQS